MEKRVLLAVVLSFLVLWGFQAYFAPAPRPAKPRPPAGEAARQPAPPQGQVPGVAGAPAATFPEASRPEAGGDVAAVVADAEERDIVVETQSVRAVFSNRGARLKSWKLKNYLDLDKRPQELVPMAMPAGTTLPFEIAVDDEAVTSRLRSALFRPSREGNVAVSGQEERLAFEFQDASGLRARKEFVFSPRSFTVRFTAQVSVGSQSLNPFVLWGPGLGDVVPGESSYRQQAQGMLFLGDDVERLSAGNLASQPVYEGQFNAAGVDDQYFISIALPKKPVRIEYQPVVVPPPAGQDPKKLSRHYVAYRVKQRGSMEDLTFFFGPKDFDVLETVDRRLVRAINFGMFDWLAVPLLRGLKWVNGYVGNYGWAIIILTLLINLVIFPLRHKSVVSMRKMQEIQPEIKAIQERYSKLKMGDPERQKMNTEMMKLYREKGVNPASGCLPMLLTLPVLFAFYSLLSQAIEIRGAEFALWIKDLSVHDPLYVTPILMGASQVWQQKLTPTGGDPVQQKMFMLMPVIFTVMFLWAPSGLVLYWLVSNVLAIGQQYITNAIVGPPKVARPPAERKVRKAAGN
jgi:YidC/Oxa1 family membrane protein insertase